MRTIPGRAPAPPSTRTTLLAMLLASAAAIPAARAGIPPKAAGSLRLVTYNIHQGRGLEEPRIDLKFRIPFTRFRIDLGSIPLPVARGGRILDRIADRIRASGADVVLLQEVDDPSIASLGIDQGQRIARRLGMHHLTGTTHRSWGGVLKTQTNVILSRWPLTGKEVISLTSGTDGEQRSMLVARVRVPGLDEPMIVANVHLSTGDDARRAGEVRRILDHLEGEPGPIVLGGDFNAGPSSATLRGLLEGGSERSIAFTDSGALVTGGRGHTSPARAPILRIDTLLVSGLPVVGSWVGEDWKDSDHLPALCDLALDPAPPAGTEPPALALLGLRGADAR